MFSRCVTTPPFIVESPTPRNSRGEGSVHASYEFIKARSTFKGLESSSIDDTSNIVHFFMCWIQNGQIQNWTVTLPSNLVNI